MRALSGGEKSPQRRMKRALSVDEKSPQRDGEPSADIQSPQQFLSSRLLAGPLNLSSQVLVERLPSHCRIVWEAG